MTHVCALSKSQDVLPLEKNAGLFQKLKAKLQKCILISDENPHSLLHFRSQHALKAESRRQLHTNPHTIHPFSKFRKWYDIYVIFLYLSFLITKPLDGCFMSGRRYMRLPVFKEYSFLSDILAWIDIALNCMTGVYGEGSNTVELRLSVITKRYITSPYCVCDILSSIPKTIFYYDFIKIRLPHIQGIVGLISVMCLLKIVRLVSLVVYIDRMTVYVNRGHRRRILTLCNLTILIVASHWLACLHFGLSKVLRFTFFPARKNDTWIVQRDLLEKTITMQYVQSFFKSTAYVLGVYISNIYHKNLPEEYILGAITYIIGKILVVYAWVFLAVAIMNSRSTNIKFAELINQLHEYMARKRLPLNLQHRISQYYYFKYQKKYVKEESIASLLSNNLKKEINLHLCRSIIKNVSLFADLNQDDVSKIVERLVLEIFLPNDTIFTSGSVGHEMYFMASGTVAVYTRSGKEICHLEDGSYFGEISLIIQGQLRVATVVAIEMCQVYRLNKRDFDACLLKNKKVMDKIIRLAEIKLKNFKRSDDDYWKTVFEQTFQDEKKE